MIERKKEKLSSDQIYTVLRERIIDLSYEPGTVLNEVDTAEEFGLSRTPVRVAFKRLEEDRLVNIIPRFGVQVVPIDFIQMRHIFELTRVLDPFAARLAAEKIGKEEIEELEAIIERMENYEDIDKDYQRAILDDEAFHRIVRRASGNPWLQDMLLLLHAHTERLWHYCETDFDSMELFSRSLSKTLESMKAKDYANTEKYAREHIDEFIFKIKEELLKL